MKKSFKPAIFLDRDGVINVDAHFVHKIEDFIFMDGIFELIRYFKENEFLVILFTNQSGIARGYFTIDDFNILNNWMLNEFKERSIPIDGVYFCPHGPDEQCQCRKPKPGMIHQAIKDFNIDISKSWVIGDRERDLEAGKNAGLTQFILMKHHTIVENNTIANYKVESLQEILQIFKKLG